MLKSVHYLLIIVVLLHLSPVSASTKEYLISLPESLQYNDNKQFFEEVFTSTYAQLNIKPQFTYLPTQRAVQLLEQGIVDAEGVRSLAVGKAYISALRVQQPLTTIDIALVCSDKQNCNTSKNTSIGILKTFEAAIAYCQANELNCTPAKSVSDLMRLLDSGLADVLLITTNSAGGHICQLNSKEIYFAPITELKVELFHYLNPKNRHLAEPLSRVFATPEIQAQMLRIKNLWIDAADRCGKQLIKLNN